MNAAYVACVLSVCPVAAAHTQETSDDTWPSAPGNRVSGALRTDVHRGPGTLPLLPYGNAESAATRKPLPFLDDRAELRLPFGCTGDVLAPGVNVEVEELPAPRYDHTHTKAEIRSLDAEASGEARETVGLTLVLAGTMQARTVGAHDANGAHSCVVVSELKILPMKEVTVYMPREYPLGTCNYNIVKRHEDKHVAIAQRLVTQFRAKFEEAIRGLRLPADAVGGGGNSASAERATSSVRVAVQGVIDDLSAAMRNENRRLDAADTQRAVMACPFW